MPQPWQQRSYGPAPATYCASKACIATLPTAFLDIAGAGASPFPLPITPSLTGTIVYGQFFVLDSGGPFLGDFTLSNGLAVTLVN